MANTPKVTAAMVLTCKERLENPKYSRLTQEEQAALLGVHVTTYRRILNGRYDHLLKDGTAIRPSPENVVHATIEYEELEHLFACEAAIKDILANSHISTQDETALFFPTFTVYNILKTHLPDSVAERIDYLNDTNA